MFDCLKLICVLVIITVSAANAQVNLNNLAPLLSNSDLNDLKKADAFKGKGKLLDDEALKIKSSGTTKKDSAKNEKKYLLKRLEASQFYQKSNNEMISLLKDNVNLFWKNNKSTFIQPIIKNYEEKANELVHKSKSLRKESENLIYPVEKLTKILDAESTEDEAINIYIKVVYAYLNQPIGYDVIKQNNEESASNSPGLDITSDKNEKETNGVVYLPLTVVPEKDTILEVEKIVSDTLKYSVSEAKSIYEIAEIKEEEVDNFNKFLENSYPDNQEFYIINFRELDYNDIDSLKEAWHKYLYAQNKLRDTNLVALSKNPNQPENKNVNSINSKVIEKEGASITLANSNSQKTGKKSSAEKNISLKTDQRNSKKEPSDSIQTIANISFNNGNNKTSGTQNIEGDSTEVAKGFVYKVQILACRVPIDKKTLENIYAGSLLIQELNEDKWYKYAVGEFNTYANARLIKNQLNIPGSFIIAYLNGKRIQISTNASQQQDYNSPSDASLIFKVQIAASKEPIAKEYINQIYSGSENTEELFEDGWYKYSLITGSDLNEAKAFIEKENIPGAFITAYLGNKKIELYKAIKLNKKY